MNEDESLPILEEYDDGVVCFGPLTDSQLERNKKLPRRTILPSNFKLSRSFVDKNIAEDLNNDESKENIAIHIDDSININQSANNLGSREKTGLVELKQSSINDENYKSTSILLDESKGNTTINIDSSVNVTLSTTHGGKEDETDIIELKQSFVGDFIDKSTSIILAEPKKNTTLNIDNSINTSRSTTYHGGEETGTTESKQNCVKDSSYTSTSILLAVPEEYSILYIDNSVNTTLSTTYHDEEEAEKKNSTIKSIQSFIKDSTPEFSSPCATQLIPPDNFIDTDVINRYIRMGSISSNESFSEDQDISTFEDETHSYIDVQKAQLTPNNSTYNESISTEQSSVLSVIQRSVNDDQKNIPDIADNVCTLKHCSQNEDNDLSVDGGSELEDSIATDEYSVTPGKKRLFDMRLAKPSFRAKIVATAAPFMDRIEESIPDDKSLNSSSVLINDVSNRPSETEKNLDLSTVTDFSLSSSVMHFNQSFDKCEVKSTKCTSGSSIDTFDGTKKSIVMNMEVEPANTSVVEKEINNEPTYLENISVSTVDFDVTPKVNETLMNTSNVSTHEFYLEKSMKITGSLITKHNTEENSIIMDVEMKSNNTNMVDGGFDDTVSSDKLSMNNKSTCFESLNKTKPTEDLDVTEQSTNTSNMTNVMFTRLPMADISMIINDHNDKVKSTEEEINLTATGIVEKVFDDITFNNKFSTNDKSMNLNETKLTEDISNASAHLSDMEKSINLKSNMTLSMIEVNKTSKLSESVNDCIKNSVEEISHEEKLVDVSSHVTRYLDFGQTMYELCNNVSSTSSNIRSNDYNDQSQENVSMIEQTIVSETFSPIRVDSNNFSVSETPLKSNLSVIIENRTLEENEDSKSPVSATSISENIMMSKSTVTSVPEVLIENPINNVPTISVSENIVNETQDVEMLDESTNQSKREPIVSISEMSIDKLENSMNDVPNNSIPENVMNKTQDIGILNESINHSIKKSIVLIDDAIKAKVTNEELGNPINNVSISSENIINENQDKEKMLNKSTSESKRRSIVTSMPEVLVENGEIFIDNVSTTSTPENIVNETLNVEMFNKSINQSKRESINTIDASKSEMIEISVTNGADPFGIETKSNEINLISRNSVGSVLPSTENNDAVNNIILNDIKHNTSCSTLEELQTETKSYNLTEEENQLNDITTEKLLVSEDVKEIVLSCSTNETSDQKNEVVISNLSTFDIIPESENPHQSSIDDQEQNMLLNNNDQQGLVSLSESVNSQEHNIFKSKTPKTQKLVDFSIVQQTPASNSQIMRQKLLDFSIVQQTPTSNIQVKNRKLLDFSIVDQTTVANMLHQTSLCEENMKKDNLMEFSSINQIWSLETVSPDVFDDGLQHTLGDFSSNNLSTISLPNVELYADESILTNSSSLNNSKLDQTITETNLNPSTFSCEVNKPKTSINQTGMINDNESSIPLKKTIEYLDSKETAEKVKPENIQCSLITDSSQGLKSNKQAVVDFSITEPQTLQANNDRLTNETVESVESNVNLIEMSMTETKSNKLVPSEIPVTVVTSNNKLMVNLDGTNNIVVDQEEYVHNAELLTDIQMYDASLLTDSPEISCTSESFHSIELEHVQDNKRKMEPVQEIQNNEKRMKVETEESKTPVSMLYKIRNMFRSSEKKSYCASNMKENNLNSDVCHKKLNFGKFEDNFIKPPQVQSLKSEIPVKSKIPCKVTDRSMMKHDELDSSLLSLNDCVKVKKTIPKFVGNPVLSDVSNSSMRKCQESRIPSKFHK